MKLVESQQANLFALGNPYPSGLGQVRLGDPIARVDEVYAGHSVNREHDGYWTVKLTDKGFWIQVAYYFDKSPKKIIDQILFIMEPYYKLGDEPFPLHKLGPQFLRIRLEEALGTPVYSKKTKVYSWKVSPNIIVEADTQITDISFHLRTKK